MRKSKKGFLYFGLPLLCFMIFIAINYYVIELLWFITFAVIVLVTMYRKNRKYITLTKLGLVLFLWFVFLCVNPIYWPSQIYRRLNRGSLIVPDTPGIAALNATFYTSSLYNGPYNRSTIEGQLQMLSDIELFMNNYLTYQFDFFQYPGVFDHIPTAEEVLFNRRDDCDGIAVVTVSLLVRLGFEAYIAESDSHWWTYVKIYGEDLNLTRRSKTYTVVYLNWWKIIGEPYMIFNQTVVIIMQPLYVSWWQQMNEGYYVEIIQEFGLPLLESPIIWVALPFALFLLGFMFSYGVGFPRNYSKKRMHLANAIFAALALAALLTSLLILPEPLMSYGTFILLGSIITLAIIIDRDYVTKWIWKSEN